MAIQWVCAIYIAMERLDKILTEQTRKLKKALSHLDYSYQQVETLSTDLELLEEHELADWEAYSARFSRVVEIFLGRYIRTVILKGDPAFEGTLRDFVQKAEKMGAIDNAEIWMGLRELRNITAHEYSESDLSQYFSRIRSEYKTLKEIRL